MLLTRKPAREVLQLDSSLEILIEHSARSKRLRLTVSPQGVRVAVPIGLAIEHGKAFAIRHYSWIIKQVERMEASARKQTEELLNSLQTTGIREARCKIITRLNELSAKHDLPYGKVSLRRQKTRWGSCSARGNINLNLALAYLPEELMDYVIVHELLHTRIRGHGPDFWHALDQRMENARDLRARLKRFNPSLICP